MNVGYSVAKLRIVPLNVVTLYFWTFAGLLFWSFWTHFALPKATGWQQLWRNFAGYGGSSSWVSCGSAGWWNAVRQTRGLLRPLVCFGAVDCGNGCRIGSILHHVACAWNHVFPRWFRKGYHCLRYNDFTWKHQIVHPVKKYHTMKHIQQQASNALPIFKTFSFIM